MKASADSDIRAVEQLLKTGAQVNSSDANGYTALHYAAHCGDIKVVQVLIKAGADIDSRTKQGVTPLMYSIDMMCGKPEITLELIRAGAGVNEVDSQGNTALHIATTESTNDVLEALLQKSADPNVLSKATGDRPLHVAAANGLVDRVELLIRYGADPKLKNARGQTAIEVANKRYPAIRRLLQTTRAR